MKFFDDLDMGSKRRGSVLKVLPPIPETGWKPPICFPDLSSAVALSFDVETKEPDFDHGPGWSRKKGHIAGLGIGAVDALGNRGQWYFPMRHEVQPEANFDPAWVIAHARPYLENPHVPKIGANLIYDVGWLTEEQIFVQGELHDVQFAEALLDEEARTALDILGNKYLGIGKSTDLMYEWIARAYQPLKGAERGEIYRTPPSLVGWYGEQDVVLPMDIIQKQIPILRQEGLYDVYRMECDLIPLLVEMRRAGVTIDLKKAETLYYDLGIELKVLYAKLSLDVGKQIVRVGSADELAVIFDHFGVKYPMTKGSDLRKPKPSFTKEWLASVEHPIGAQINAIRMIEKIRDTFIKSYILESHVDGKVHGNFHPLRGEEGGAKTGRFASSQPNLQNISNRSKLGKQVRHMYIHDDGHMCFGAGDQSQIEYRALVHYAVGKGSDAVRLQYQNDPSTDYHKMTQSLVKEVGGVLLPRNGDEAAKLGMSLTIKEINFGLCLAEGSLVLTDVGLVPIEQITLGHKLWDGDNWVSHKGLLYRGIKLVIECEELWLTPDHRVYLEDSSSVQTRKLTSKISRSCIARTGDSHLPIRHFTISSKLLSQIQRSKRQGFLVFLRGLSAIQRNCGLQHQKRYDKKLPLPIKQKISRQTSFSVRRALRRNSTTLPTWDKYVAKLWRSWNSKSFPEQRKLHKLYVESPSPSRLQKRGYRQNQQRRSLHTRKFTTSFTICKFTESSSSNKTAPQKESRRGVRQRMARVFDILNAGHHRRFTVNNLLVSNCYGMSENKLGRSAGLDKKKSSEVFKAYHAGAPYVKATMAQAASEVQANGFITTILGRRTRFKLWEPVEKNYIDKELPLPYEQAIRVYGSNIKRAYEYKAINYRLQGTAAEALKMAMLRCWKEGVYHVMGVPRLTVHDENGHSIVDDSPEVREATTYMIHCMETSIPQFRIPLRFDWSTGANWGEC